MNESEMRISQGVAIHGGVGTLPPEDLTPALNEAYRATLRESLGAGNAALKHGGSALDAVVAAVQVMEDSELFNAGRGSNFDERGIITMDASIMDGGARRAGAVAGVTAVRNPIGLARLVMDRSEHVLLIEAGAEAFARSQGIELVDPAFFHTDKRWEELQRAKANTDARPNVLGSVDPKRKWGTVGAVARDAEGRLAAATSTGGMANKTWGRVGDSPIIGAGTYASEHCAVSCTGWGEYFIRNATAYEVHTRMSLLGESLGRATKHAIWKTLEGQVEGAGGLVAMDADGRVEFSYSTRGMYRGWIGDSRPAAVAIFEE